MLIIIINYVEYRLVSRHTGPIYCRQLRCATGPVYDGAGEMEIVVAGLSAG